ncbi:MAG: hypothetical protein GY926_10695 [bacterium]|nr:hypothetical protein [bacterium]
MAVFLFDNAELEEFVDQLDRIPDARSGTSFPIHNEYQLSRNPLPAGLAPSWTFRKDSPAGGDFMLVQIYEVEEEVVGVWVYSNWN